MQIRNRPVNVENLKSCESVESYLSALGLIQISTQRGQQFSNRSVTVNQGDHVRDEAAARHAFRVTYRGQDITPYELTFSDD
ncbi:MAG: hypothetical protein HY731_12890, partial [Candidatus Tectomicrobia bacterium]|nr:hypothetical protein [Candidatus Tectomicrobia bacterium]